MSDPILDLRFAAAPKSDQLNADDLIGCTKTITVTGVRAGSPDQPITINYEGDSGRPYKPCKSMRRVLIAAWGENGYNWIGRSMTLYQDPSVRFGGAEVGGIRISHLSHIIGTMNLKLTVTRAKRQAYTVQPLEVAAPQPYPADQFAANLPAWQQAIADGKLTAEQVINKAGQKGLLTEEQQQQIRATSAQPQQQQEEF